MSFYIKKNSKLVIAAVLLFPVLLAAQSAGIPDIITNIVITGNYSTGDNVILRELLVQSGSEIDEALLTKSKKRLENLYLFNRINFQLLPQNNQGYILLIEVTERLYFYPFPVFRIHDRDWNKLSYGAQLVHQNFRGQNERLSAALILGYQPGFGFAYSDQWAGDSLHLTTGFAINKFTSTHRTLDFSEQHLQSELSIGKWWTYEFKTELSLLYDRIKVGDEWTPLMHSGNSEETVWGTRLYLRYDSRDLYAYPGEGWYLRFRLQHNGLFSEFNNYDEVLLDMRRYFTIGNFIFATRFHQEYQFGDVPVYRLNYLGFSERIRGWFYDVFEGHHLHLAAIETRFPLFDTRYLNFSLPLIPDQYLKDLKFGISMSLFMDSGIIWNRSNEYGINNFHTGAGVGLLFHVPYVEILRVESAVNLNQEIQFIVEIGTAL